MALRNHLLLGNRTAAPAFGDGSPFLPRKPSGTRAQRLALRRSVLLRANLDSSSASAMDLLTETARPRRAAGAGAKRENRLQAAEIPRKLAANGELVSAPLVRSRRYHPHSISFARNCSRWILNLYACIQGLGFMIGVLNMLYSSYGVY